jgi:SAM-dependent methyltransferase
MSPDYNGYQGDSKEAAILRDAHNRQTLSDDTIHLRSRLDEILQPQALVLDAGCGTGYLARIIAASHPEIAIIATDVSLPMCQLASKNCRGYPVMIVRTPTSKRPPMPFRNSAFDIVLNRLAEMDPVEAFRLLRNGGYAVSAGLIETYWQEVKQVFPNERLITFPRDGRPQETLVQIGFNEAEFHSWRMTKIRSLAEIIMVLSYAPILHNFEATSDQSMLQRLASMYGGEEGIRLTEGETLLIGRKQ